jgi:hypothetical protein
MTVRTEARIAKDDSRAQAWPLAGPRRKRTRLRELSIILYATILILFLANPHAVSERLTDLPQGAATGAASFVADMAEGLSKSLGMQESYDAARSAFLENVMPKREGQR